MNEVDFKKYSIKINSNRSSIPRHIDSFHIERIVIKTAGVLLYSMVDI